MTLRDIASNRREIVREVFYIMKSKIIPIYTLSLSKESSSCWPLIIYFNWEYLKSTITDYRLWL